LSSSKILTLPQTDLWVATQRAAGRRIGFTCGAFDLLHAGHIQYLQAARTLCDTLLIAVNSDASIQRYKSPLRPINPLADRQYLLAALSCVDAITTLEEDRPLPLIERWRPDFYIKGGDYAPEKLRSAATVQAYGGQTVVIPPQYPTSTSKILDRINTLQLHATPTPPPSHPHKLALLDRDGTLIENVPFLHEPHRITLKPGVVEGLQLLTQAGYTLAIVTNQQGLGLGYFTMDQFIATNQRLLSQLNANIARIYFCPHSQSDQCQCRKPAPGMLLRALTDFATSPTQSLYFGDTPADQQAAQSAQIPYFEVTNNFLDAVHSALLDNKL
jgi:rfaE bifunctional protein nucleotidyltransferase chain/domain